MPEAFGTDTAPEEGDGYQTPQTRVTGPAIVINGFRVLPSAKTGNTIKTPIISHVKNIAETQLTRAPLPAGTVNKRS